MSEQAPNPQYQPDQVDMTMHVGELDNQTAAGQVEYSSASQPTTLELDNPIATNTSEGSTELSQPEPQQEERSFGEEVGRKAAIHVGASAVAHMVKFGAKEAISNL